MADEQIKTVLIVEDEAQLRLALRTRLKRDGFHVLEADDGDVGLKIIKEQKPDFVVLDILMPKMNGIEVLREAKADASTKDIPILMLTNSPDQEHISEGLVAGAKGYLVKSNYSLQEVAEKIRGFLG